MSKKAYYVTDVQGPRPDIGGARRKVGERITLSDKQAEFETSRGTVITQEAYEKLQADAANEAAKPGPAKPAKGS